MRKELRRGQSILEYTLLLGAIIAVVIIILFTGAGGGTSMKDRVEQTYDRSGQALEDTTTDVQGHGIFK